MTTDYSTVTEAAGSLITREALSMMYTRYSLARSLSDGKDVLEVACGSGQGLGLIARTARSVVGGDYTYSLLKTAHSHYRNRIPLIRLDAHELPFRDESFDVVLLYEAIYYLRSPDLFLEETARVLRSGGKVLICSVNPDWPDFNPSPFSVKYYTAEHLHAMLLQRGFSCELYGAFPAHAKSWTKKVVSVTKRLAVRLHLIPRTMKSKAWLKRVFLGPLVPVPAELTDNLAKAADLVPLNDVNARSGYKVVYAIGTKGGRTGYRPFSG